MNSGFSCFRKHCCYQLSSALVSRQYCTGHNHSSNFIPVLEALPNGTETCMTVLCSLKFARQICYSCVLFGFTLILMTFIFFSQLLDLLKFTSSKHLLHTQFELCTQQSTVWSRYWRTVGVLLTCGCEERDDPPARSIAIGCLVWAFSVIFWLHRNGMLFSRLHSRYSLCMTLWNASKRCTIQKQSPRSQYQAWVSRSSAIGKCGQPMFSSKCDEVQI